MIRKSLVLAEVNSFESTYKKGQINLKIIKDNFSVYAIFPLLCITEAGILVAENPVGSILLKVTENFIFCKSISSKTETKFVLNIYLDKLTRKDTF